MGVGVVFVIIVVRLLGRSFLFQESCHCACDESLTFVPVS